MENIWIERMHNNASTTSKKCITKFAKHQTYIQVKGYHPWNSTDVQLVSRSMYLKGFVYFFGWPQRPQTFTIYANFVNFSIELVA